MTWASRILQYLPITGISIADLFVLIGMWQQRKRSRRALLWLDEHQLRDIGIDRAAAMQEASKPFWRN